jgi:hypothetical protein
MRLKRKSEGYLTSKQQRVRQKRDPFLSFPKMLEIGGSQVCNFATAFPQTSRRILEQYVYED